MSRVDWRQRGSTGKAAPWSWRATRTLCCIGLLAVLSCWTQPVDAESAGDPDATVKIRRGHFIADALPGRDGYTYTLTSRLSDMLAELEAAYGKRDSSYTIVGIEFGADESPQVWYPGNRRHVVIQLARNAMLDEGLALFQLAHEAVHLLAPSGGRHSTVLEEGLAANYSVDHVKRRFPDRSFSRMTSYETAGKLVRELMREDAGCVARLRRIKPSFGTWRVQDFAASCSRVNKALATSLLLPFSR